MDLTACGHRMAHRKWKETNQQPSMLPGPAVPGCSLVSFHFLWAILCPQAVQAGSSVFVNLVYHIFIPSFFQDRLVGNVKVPADLEDYCNNRPIEMTATKRPRNTVTTRARKIARRPMSTATKKSPRRNATKRPGGPQTRQN